MSQQTSLWSAEAENREISLLRNLERAQWSVLNRAFKKSLEFLVFDGKQSLIAVFCQTCTRLRIQGLATAQYAVPEILVEKIEGMPFYSVTDKERAQDALKQWRASGATFTSTLAAYTDAQQKRRAAKKVLAAQVLASKDLTEVAKATEKSLSTLAKKFPQHAEFFHHMLKAIDEYR